MNIVNDYIEDNVTQFFSSYNNDASKLSEIEKSNISDILKNRSDEYMKRIEVFLDTLNFLNLTLPLLNKRKNDLASSFRDSASQSNKILNESIIGGLKKRTTLSIQSYTYTHLSNSVNNYLEEKQSLLDSQINNLKYYLKPIYSRLHDFLFNFTKNLAMIFLIH